MKNCKNYKIYKFKYALKGDSPDLTKQRCIRAEELTEFKIKIINKFTDKPFEQWVLENRLSGFEKAFEYFESIGFQFETQYKSLYMAIPKDRTDVIDFFDNNIPKWVEIVKKI